MNSQFLPFREVEVHFDAKERPRLRAGEFAEEDSEIAYSLACFASWVSGKGFSRAAWMTQHTEPNRKARQAQLAALPRALRKAKCRFCLRKISRGHAKNCKGMLVANGIACFVKWAGEGQQW